jgi:hypothetical protein
MRSIFQLATAVVDEIRRNSAMRFFESWWNRAPMMLRVGLMVGCIVAAILGGSADGYWQ